MTIYSPNLAKYAFPLPDDFYDVEVSDPVPGVPHSEESKRLMSQSRMGNTNALGHKHSDETKQRLSERKLQLIADGDWSPPDQTGTKHSQSTREKMSQSSPRRKQVMVDGVMYQSAGKCAKALGLYTIQVSDRCRNPKTRWREWQYA